MKKITISIIAFLAMQMNYAQDSSKIVSLSQSIVISSYQIAADSTIKSVVSHFGKPDRIEKVGGMDRMYVYDQLGFSFDAGQTGIKVEAVIFNFNWDNDKKCAKSAYAGVLLLDGYELSESTTSEEIRTHTDKKDIKCLGELLCMSNPTNEGLAFMMGFSAEKKVTQFTFAFKKR
jgi:hypothetical protein